MKYHQIIMAKRVAPDATEFRQFYVPVEERDGTWVPCGPMREETDRVTQGSIFAGVAASECSGADNAGPLDAIEAPVGWTVISRDWLPDNYVPQSAEVTEEGRRRAAEYLKEMLGNE
jgi:hypothetical protein